MLVITVNTQELEKYMGTLSSAQCDRLVFLGLLKGMELGTADIQRTAVIRAPKRTGLLASSIHKAVYEEMPTGWA